MKPLYSQEEFSSSKSREKLPCECYECQSTFFASKNLIQQEIKLSRGRIKFCSKECLRLYNIKSIQIKCTNCNKQFLKIPSIINKSINHFCSMSCSGTYNNKHKKYGIRRSKLEVYLEDQLTQKFADLEIHFNRKDTIGSELDIYIPSLNLAFELNGIFHYEPIFGSNKLDQIQANDFSKSKACFDKEIDLCVIDTSQQKRFTESSSQVFLNIITDVINQR